MLEAAKRAKASGDASDVGVILNFGAVQARMPAVPQFQGEESRYVNSLRPGG
ncbi:MAG: hypothetical protein HY928_08980 [Elusimicrobia bacterium]|nr:hypothetical protein [Elusimicrobiota bacterium]